jgi:vacuolar-type H+-ATPase subunit I/STV1
MKNLSDYIYESIVNESLSKVLRFEFGDLDKKDETIKSIENLGSKNGIYTEKINNGIKIKVTDDNRDSLGGIQDVLQSYIEKMQDDDKANEGDVKKLADQINKLNDFIDEPEEDEDEDTSNEGE